MKKLFRVLPVAMPALLTFLSSGCTKDIDFVYRDIDPVTVIEGNLSEDGADVVITLTTPMDEPMDLTPLTDAYVKMEDVTTGSVTELTLDDRGHYVSAAGGVPGHDYRLSVSRGGERFDAVSAYGDPVMLGDVEFSWLKMPYDYVALMQVTVMENPDVEEECFWVRIYRNGKPYRWTAVNDRYAVDGKVDIVFMTTRQTIDKEDDDDILLDGDEITITVTPVDAVMYDYLEALTAGQTNGPRMFGGDFCLGYFLASPKTSTTVVFHPDDIPYLD